MMVVTNLNYIIFIWKLKKIRKNQLNPFDKCSKYRNEN